jgi:tetratricopeptide (TPR) repeat protein
MESKKVVFFNRLSFAILLATLFLSLFFFVPYVPVTLEASKGFLISIGMTLSIFFWFVARLGEGTFKIPKERLILFAGLIPLVFLAASFFSSSKYISLFGSGFEFGTFGSMLVLFILFFLSSVYFQSKKRFGYFYKALFAGAAVLALFELVNIFIGFGQFVSVFKGITSGNLLGSWNNFGFFFGLIVLLSIFTLEFTRIKGVFRILQYFLLTTGLLFLVIINTPLIWLLVGLFSIVIFVYIISMHHARRDAPHEEHHKKNFPFLALIVVFISLIFLIGNNFIGGVVAKYVGISNPDVRPSIVSTSKIAYQAIKHNPLFGTGPNTFVIDWTLWRSPTIAQTDFWNIDFAYGFSPLFTFAATTGILGLAVFILFLVTFTRRSITSLKIALENSQTNYYMAMTLITSVYSWVIFLIYNPNIVMLMIAFASSGVLVGILVYNKVIPVKEFSYLNGDPRNSFFSILGLMVLMIGTLSITYVYIEKFTSTLYFSKGLNAGSTVESLSRSQQMLANAIVLDKNDAYYRVLSQIFINKIGLLINDKTISEDILKSNVQQLVNLAETSAAQAVSRNPNQYLNYVNLGTIYSSLVPLSVAQSYEGAVSAFMKARKLNPSDPSIPLAMAQLELVHKSNDAARKFIAEALALRPNYTDAIFLLAEIDLNEGDTSGAIKQAERAGKLTPNDPTVFFRLGMLRYNNGDYNDAISAFEQAVILNVNYLRARYYLGQAYQKVGRTNDALIQYKILSKVLPDNEDIKKAMSSLSAQTPTTSVTPDENVTTPATKPQSKPTTKPATTLPER